MKTALVCGAGGFIGSHLVRRLKAEGFGLGEYRSDLYSSDRKAVAPAPVTFVAAAADAAAALYRSRGLALVEAMEWTRDLSNEPANVVYPEAFVERARAAFAGVPGVSIEVLDVPAMQKLGMGALTGVGAGSARPPRLLVVRYKGAGAPAGGRSPGTRLRRRSV